MEEIPDEKSLYSSVNIPGTIPELDDKEIPEERPKPSLKKIPSNLLAQAMGWNQEMTMSPGDKDPSSGAAGSSSEPSSPSISWRTTSINESLISPSSFLRSKLVENITLKRMGSESPDQDGSTGAASFSLFGRSTESMFGSVSRLSLKKIPETDANGTSKRRPVRSSTFMDTTEFSKNSSKSGPDALKLPDRAKKRKNTVTGAPECSSRKMSALSVGKFLPSPALRRDSVSRFVSTLSIVSSVSIDKSYLAERVSLRRKSSVQSQRKQSGISVEVRPDIRQELQLPIEIKKPQYSARKKGTVLFCCILMQMCVSEIFSLGPVYSELLSVFKTSKSETSLVQSLPQGITYGCGVFVDPLISRFGLRVVVLIGALLSSFGFASSAFVNSVPAITVLIGLVSGFGLCIVNVVSYAAISKYFDAGQNYAIAAVSSGLSLGTTFLPFYQMWIIQIYRWDGNFLLMAGIMLQLCAMAFVFENKPLTVVTSSRSPNPGNEMKLTQKFLLTMKSPIFVAYLLAQLLVCLSTPIATLMIMDFGMTEGYGKSRSTLLLTVFSFSCTIGRFVAGIASACRLSGMFVFLFTMLASGLLIMALALVANYAETMAILCLIGIILGCCFTAALVALLEMVGPENYAFCFGICSTMLGLGYIGCGPLAGFVADMTQSYSMSFLTAGSIAVGTMLFLLLAVILTKQLHMLKRRVVDEDNEELSSEIITQ